MRNKFLELEKRKKGKQIALWTRNISSTMLNFRTERLNTTEKKPRWGETVNEANLKTRTRFFLKLESLLSTSDLKAHLEKNFRLQCQKFLHPITLLDRHLRTTFIKIHHLAFPPTSTDGFSWVFSDENVPDPQELLFNRKICMIGVLLEKEIKVWAMDEY